MVPALAAFRPQPWLYRLQREITETLRIALASFGFEVDF